MNADGTAQRHRTDSAGLLAIGNCPIVDLGTSAGVVRELLRTREFDAIDLVVATRDSAYEGVAELKAVLQADADTPIAALIDRSWPHVSPETDQEHAVETARLARVSTIPVVGRPGAFVGVIPAVMLLAVLAEEHHEDVHRLVGIMRANVGARHALEDPPLRRVALRLPWLLVGLAMSTSATAVMASFEHAIKANVTIAFFIPALVYLTDAIGTQTEAIAVRGLSLRKRPLAYILAREVVTGGVIGLALGCIAFGGVWIVFADVVAAFGVGLSLFAAGTLASTIGLLLPWLLSRFNVDPAFGSGPVGTIVQDVLTILVYFAVMTQLFALAG
jgi:magnesium transporter